ncbi:MAG: GNAT family acetyltransferase [Pseudomonadota bacterium]
MHIRPFEDRDQAHVIALWQRCGLTRPWNDPVRDIARKAAVQADWFVVALSAEGGLVGSAMIGYDGHRGWINYLAVDPTHQGGGIGRALVAHAERVLTDVGCPKLNLQIRESNTRAIEFYRRLGFQTDAAISMGKRLIDDAGDSVTE